jgi:hypothetical protein
VSTRVKIVDGRSLTQVRRKIRAMRERSQTAMPAWHAVLDWWTHGNTQHFGTQGARWRTPWRELNPTYLATKRDEGWMGDILVRTSDLRRSLTDRPLPIEHITATEFSAGTNVSYAAYHQDGTRKMPPRKLINARQVRAEGAVTSALANWIIRGETKVSAIEVKR